MDEYKVPIPPPGTFTNSLPLLDEVAELVFGVEVVNDLGTVDDMYRECAKVFVNRVWEGLVSTLKRNIKRSQKMCSEMDGHLKGEHLAQMELAKSLT